MRRHRALVVATAALTALALAACVPSVGAPEDETPLARASSIARPTANAPGTATPSVQPPIPTPSAGTGGVSSTATAAPPSAPPGARSVTISAVGDVSLARQVNDWMAQYGAGYPYELILPLLDGDIVFGNLEGALTDRGEPWPKSFNFRTPPQFAPGLATAGFDVVALANNHAVDYGMVGLQDTIAALDAAGVRHAGAGDAQQAWAGQTLETNGLRVAFIACALTPTEGSGFSIDQWAIGVITPGMAVCTPDLIAQAVSFAGPESDFVVVSIHAGDEYVNAPNATQVVLADAALDAGADVVLGHHAHVVQPVEQRGSQLVAWGLGNFIFDLDQWDLAGIPEPRVSLVLNVTLTEGVGVTSWEARAVVLDAEQDRPRPATAEEAAVLQQLIAQ